MNHLLGMFVSFFVCYVEKNCMTEASFRLNCLMLRMFSIRCEGKKRVLNTSVTDLSILVNFIEFFFFSCKNTVTIQLP